MQTFNCKKCGLSFESDLKTNIICCPNCGNMDFPETKLRIGFHINGFELIRKIGSGAMGTVWLAKQTSMQRNVAVKILSPSVHSRKNFIERFQGEIKNSAKLDHPNIAQAFDAGFQNGFYYLVSAYIEGEDLEHKLLQNGRIPGKTVLQIALGIAEALSYAWSEFNMLHRDIKPSNIIIDKKNIPKLLDMGLSKCLDDDPSLTYDGEIVGTPYYMSPEQAKGKFNIDLRSDIYSLGATLYHSVTGHLPFDGTTSVSILAKHITEPLIPPIERYSDLLQELNDLIMKMMEKNPENRIQTWYEVIGEIQNILNEKELTVEPTVLKLKKENSNENTENGYESPYLKQLKLQEKEIKILEKKSDVDSKKSKQKNKLLSRIIYAMIFLGFAGCLIYFAYFMFLKEFFNFRLNFNIFYNFVELKANSLFVETFSLIQIYLFNNTQYTNIISTVSLKTFGIELLLIIGIFFSGFWSAAKAQQYRKNCFLHFTGGLLVPYIYPLILFRINDNTIKKDNSGTEIPEKKIIKYFKNAADKYNEVDKCFEFELYDNTRIYAERVTEVKHNMLVIQAYTDAGDSKIQRIPYSRIKNYTKL